MKELYHEFFHIPKNGKVREKVMLMRTALTVIVMLVCLFALSFTAFAYFSHSVVSGSSIIKSAHFEAQITVKDTTVQDGTGEIALTRDGKYQVAALETGKEYSVMLSAPTASDSAKTGFCVITYEGGQTVYHTQQLGVDEAVEGGRTPSITFTLTVDKTVKVYFLSHWGTSSSYDPYKANKDNEELYILDKDVVNITVVDSTSGVNNTTDEKDETSGDTTSEETTPSETTEPETTPTEVVYTIQPGDTLWEIAKTYNTSVEALKAYNGLTSNTIVSGRVLKIPPADYEIPADTTTADTTTAPEDTTPAETTAPETSEITEPADTTEQTTTQPEATETTVAEDGE